MDSTLITALLTLFTALVPVLGTFLSILINNKIKDDKQRKLALDLLASVQGAVKATAQTVTSKQRDGSGNLKAEVAAAAKAEALEAAKILLGSEQMAMATAKYGGSAEVNKVLGTLLEAALHDVKKTKASATSSASVDAQPPTT